MIKNDMGEHFSLHEMEKMYIEARQRLEDAVYEKEMYSKDSREIRAENASLKQSIEFHKKENAKAFNKLLEKIFPNFWKFTWMGKGHFPSVIQDMEDGMMGLTLESFASTPVGVGAKCYMQDESIRVIDSGKKWWISID